MVIGIVRIIRIHRSMQSSREFTYLRLYDVHVVVYEWLKKNHHLLFNNSSVESYVS